MASILRILADIRIRQIAFAFVCIGVLLAWRMSQSPALTDQLMQQAILLEQSKSESEDPELDPAKVLEAYEAEFYRLEE